MTGSQSIISFISMTHDWLELHSDEELNLYELTDYINTTCNEVSRVVFNPVKKIVRLFHGAFYIDVQLTYESTNIEAYQTIVDAL